MPYVRLGPPARAAAEFQRAVALDPSSAMQQSNLALVLAQLGQTSKAVQWARHALQIDYVLGCILAEHASNRAEAILHLELASRTLPVGVNALQALKR